jgi:3-phosphoshikimate 1-carboxyvinyltransferase
MVHSIFVPAGTIQSTIALPPSKSHANRMLILAATLPQAIHIHGEMHSLDVVYLKKCLREVGLTIIDHTDKHCEVQGQFPLCEATSHSGQSEIRLDVGEGGTTARFLSALLMKGKRRYRLKMQGKLASRPWEELIQVFTQAGGHCVWENGELCLQGPLQIDHIPLSISCARSTQFISALQLAYAIEGLKFKPIDLMTSTPYWEMTLELVKNCATHQWKIPLDWSSAAYPFVYSALFGPEIFLPDLYYDAQADAVLFNILQGRGAVTQMTGGISCQRLKDFSPLTVDLTHCPDLSLALAFLMAHLHGESRLLNTNILKHKESDRLSEIINLLAHFSVPTNMKGDALIIHGGQVKAVPASSKTLTTEADHRVVMTAALFLRAHGGGQLAHPECVAKSFPDYFLKMFSL